jgi:hypothetical protein
MESFRRERSEFKVMTLSGIDTNVIKYKRRSFRSDSLLWHAGSYGYCGMRELAFPPVLLESETHMYPWQ